MRRVVRNFPEGNGERSGGEDDRLVAILTVHLRGGFFLPNGFEFALALLAANTALVLLGSGEASVDRLLAKS